MSNRILILGSNGQLGTALSELFDRDHIDYLGLDFPEIDLTKPKTYYNEINTFKPDILINCVAYTDVFKAEIDVGNAMNINGTCLKFLVDICNANNIYLVHISTDYVFSGETESGYSEKDIPDPINIYGLTKLVGEKIIKMYSRNYVIVRTAALYGGSKLKSTNIVKKLISLAKEDKSIKLVFDEINSPTFTLNLAEQIKIIITHRLKGIIHATSENSCNWVEFGSYLYRLLGITVSIQEVKSSYFNNILRKPKNSILNNIALKRNNQNIMLNWKEALKQYLNIVENL